MLGLFEVENDEAIHEHQYRTQMFTDVPRELKDEEIENDKKQEKSRLLRILFAHEGRLRVDPRVEYSTL